MKAKTNMTMLCDFYELTMGNGYFQTGLTDRICYFDVFYRSVPDQGGFAIAAGLAQVVEYIENLHFDEEDIAYLRSKDCFSEEFLDYLKNFSFTGDIWAVPEGTPIFPGEPILTVRAPAIQAQFIETFVLLCLNHQCLIATKSNRIVRAAEGRPVAEFGSRRAHGPDGALLGARASYIAGCSATACTMADQHYGSPATGTMAHSWVQMFPDEYTAFKTYCELYPNNATHPAGGHLQRLKIRRSQRHPGVQGGAGAQGHHQVRHPPGLRRLGLPVPKGPGDAGRGGADRM